VSQGLRFRPLISHSIVPKHKICTAYGPRRCDAKGTCHEETRPALFIQAKATNGSKTVTNPKAAVNHSLNTLGYISRSGMPEVHAKPLRYSGIQIGWANTDHPVAQRGDDFAGGFIRSCNRHLIILAKAGGRDPQLLPVLGHRSTSQLKTLGMEGFHNGLVGQRFAFVFGLDHLRQYLAHFD